MGQSQQESEGESEGQSRSRERINRSGEEERKEETEREGPNVLRSMGTYGFGRNTAVGTESVDNSGTGEETADRGLVNYDPGADAARLSRQYDVDLRSGGAFEKIQRLEQEFGSQRVQRWAEEGMRVDTMGKPQDMAAFRERQADRPEAVPDDVERQNRASRQRNEGRQDEGPAGSPGVPDEVRRVVASPGRSLDDTVQREMEEKMGGDFQDVQVHTGPQAAAAADSINARAFTVGNHVAFNRGEYQPASNDGKKVLAHELTHVRQQTEGAVSLLPQAGVDHPGAVGLAGDWHVQPKLEVSSPDDPAEKEAERVAEQVVEMSGGASASAGSESDEQGASRQDDEASGRDDEASRQDDETSRQEDQASRQEGGDSGGDVDIGLVRTVPVSRSAAGGGEVGGEGESAVRGAVQGGGKPLPSDTRSEMESKMGADFSDVSVHTGPEADAAAKSINAEAYTMGSNIAFAGDNYQPGSKSGKKLLAHELTHVAQQTGGASASVDRVQRQAGGMSMASSTGEATYRVSINGQMVQVAGGTIHIVERGDNLSEIAAQYGVSGGWRSVYDLNRDVIGPDPNLIHPGTVLLVPNTGWRTVDPNAGDGQSGESGQSGAGGQSEEERRQQSLPQGEIDTASADSEREGEGSGLHTIVQDLGEVASLEDVKGFFLQLIGLDTKLSGEVWFKLPIQTNVGRLDLQFTLKLDGEYKVEDDIYAFGIGGSAEATANFTIAGQGVDVGVKMGPSLDLEAEDPMGIWELWRLAVREDTALALEGMLAMNPTTAALVGYQWYHAIPPETIIDPVKDALLGDEYAEQIQREMTEDEKAASSFKVEGSASGGAGGGEVEGVIGVEGGIERTSEAGELLQEEEYIEGSFKIAASTPNGWGGEFGAKAKFYSTEDWELDIGFQVTMGNIGGSSELMDNINQYAENIEVGMNEAVTSYLDAALSNDYLPYIEEIQSGLEIALGDEIGSDAGGDAGNVEISGAANIKRDRNGNWVTELAIIQKSSVEVDALMMGGRLSQETKLIDGTIEW